MLTHSEPLDHPRTPHPLIVHAPAPASPGSAPFTQWSARQLIQDAKPGEVHIVAAPPGVGKSMWTRQVIRDTLLLPPAVSPSVGIRRVLWATHSIATDTALGKEALAAFQALHVPVQIIYRRANFKPSGAASSYEEQFVWPTDPAGHPEPMVKIISHARIGLIFGNPGNPTSAGLLGADLLVIDEDPMSGLLIASPTSRTDTDSPKYRLEGLATSGDPVFQALLRIVQTAPADSSAGRAVQSFTLKNTYDLGHALYGRTFWHLFLRQHPQPVDTVSLSAALKKNGIADPDLIAEAFAEDARCAVRSTRRPARYRTRFGIHWEGRVSNPDWARMALFRFTLRRPLEVDLPVIVLDGYAKQELYEALFLEQPHVKFHGFAPAVKLSVECSELLSINPLEDRKAKGLPHRLHVAEELAEQRRVQKMADPGSKQLLLTNKDLYTSSSGWQKLLQGAYTHVVPGLTFSHPESAPGPLLAEPNQMYWHAGRGLDSYNGADIYALTLPKLSSLHRDYALAAVVLDNPALRQRLHGHARASELLQMLNRGRQPGWAAKSAPTGGPVPRVVVGATIKKVRMLLGDLVDRAELREYRPLLQLTKGSQNPRWRDMTTALAQELLARPEFYQGLPIQLLESLPLHDRGSKDRVLIMAKLSDLALSSAPDSHLYQAFHAPLNWRYWDVCKGGKSSDGKMLKAAMLVPKLGLTAQTAYTSVGASTVYVRTGTGATASSAFDAFNSWLVK